MTTSYLDRGEGRVAYELHGQGPLVVCLPGMGDLRSVYRFTVPALVAAGYRVATMDLRGHGDSDDGFTAYDDVAAGRDALALVDHLAGGGRALLVGNSMAGGAAVWAAAEAPGRVAGLALIDPFVRDPDTPAIARLALRVALRRPWGAAVWLAYLRRAYPGRPPADFDAYRRLVAESLRRGQHWRSFVRTTRTTHAPVQARLPEVQTPALVVMGERDPDWSDPTAEARWVAGALRAELLVVPAAGHYPMAEYPELVNPALVAFAQRVHVRA